MKLKPFIAPHKIIVGDFNNPPPPPYDRRWKQKLNEDIGKVTEIMNQMDLIDMCRKLKIKKIIPNSQHFMVSSPKVNK